MNADDADFSFDPRLSAFIRVPFHLEVGLMKNRVKQTPRLSNRGKAATMPAKNFIVPTNNGG